MATVSVAVAGSDLGEVGGVWACPICRQYLLKLEKLGQRQKKKRQTRGAGGAHFPHPPLLGNSTPNHGIVSIPCGDLCG